MYTVVALLFFVFKGGSSWDFAEALARKAATPVCVALETQGIPAVSTSYESPSELARRLAKALQFDLADAKRFGFGPRSYSDAMFMPAFRQDYWQRFPSGRITIEKTGPSIELKPAQESTFLAVSDLSALPWSKRLTIHPFLQTYRCVLTGKGTEEEILKAISAAVGGKLAIRKAAYDIELDCASVRRRWIERYRISLAADRSKYNVANAEFAIGALTQAPDSVIRSALAKQDARAYYEIPRISALRTAAEKKIEASRRLASGEGGVTSGADYLSLIDFDKPWNAELAAGGAVSLRMSSKDGRGVIHF